MPPTDRSTLASLIHARLRNVYSFGSRPTLRKHLAYLLSVVSNEIFSEVGQAIGLIEVLGSGRSNPSWGILSSRSSSSVLTLEGSTRLPEFIPLEDVSHMDRGARSLALLEVAQPNHPLCHPPHDGSWRSLCSGWAWTDDEVEKRADLVVRHVVGVDKAIDDWKWDLSSSTRAALPVAGVGLLVDLGARHDPASGTELLGSKPSNPEASHNSDLSGLHVFDLEPGLLPLFQLDRASGDSNSISYHTFLADFPENLPILAPTLETLLDAVALQPLVAHARILSSSLLDLFLSDFDFIGHLEILHRFVLFGNPSFAVRVRTALFTDSPTLIDSENDWKSAHMYRARDRRRASSRPGHKRQQSTDGGVPNHTPWGVGLNPALSDRGAWPPSGSDLAFALRTVIVDTLDEDMTENEEGEKRTGNGKVRDTIWTESEWRLGFIIKPFDDDDERGTEEHAWADAFCEHRRISALCCRLKSCSHSYQRLRLFRDGLQTSGNSIDFHYSCYHGQVPSNFQFSSPFDSRYVIELLHVYFLE